MLISLCIPCHNRTHDLKNALPSFIKAANKSQPVEIVILDYNSPDDLAEYLKPLPVKHIKYTGREYYHMAHARNLSVMAAKGEFVVISSADVVLNDDYFETMREALAEDDYVWLRHSNRFIGVVGMWKSEFVDAGGFDERFEFYGKEDKDLIRRLERRGGKYKVLPSKMSLIPTSKEDKFKNYRLKLGRNEMSRRSKPIYEENIVGHVLVANKGKSWGKQ